MKNCTRAYVIGKLGFKTGAKISYNDLTKSINKLNATQNFKTIHYELNDFNSNDELKLTLTENKIKTFLKFGLHYDGLYKSAILSNITQKRMLFKNDVLSFDLILGDNFRYNLDYYIDNGFYFSFGFKSRYNQFNKNITTDFNNGFTLRQLNINSINIDFSAFEETHPEANTEVETADMYAPYAQTLVEPKKEKKTEKRFIDAISYGLRQSMERYDNLVLMGQDIAEYGGVFKITDGFVEKFGKPRVRNTPICESAIVGAGLGLSIKGMRLAAFFMEHPDLVKISLRSKGDLPVDKFLKEHFNGGGHANAAGGRSELNLEATVERFMSLLPAFLQAHPA